ncbi:hypothetical protein SAMN06264364_101222 [Quadrisphaera granulorum]|uniref:Uncharacterized protein n=1 Tax=Quadrisphaera granulorum TaxID=317664 RepID=A0A316B161_9ACTN|nr:hypothetical protein [Quadrisphaera granulorum]PWJ56247.1 hypothetical protein BXY45_101222 [Quadrisphaera granulorum]SZE94881.1 hypothetical protein SAMN06264364_101222 [Quadrisphaera granulorum]
MSATRPAGGHPLIEETAVHHHPDFALAWHHQRSAELREQAMWSRQAASRRDARRAARLAAKAQRLADRAAQRAVARPLPAA